MKILDGLYDNEYGDLIIHKNGPHDQNMKDVLRNAILEINHLSNALKYSLSSLGAKYGNLIPRKKDPNKKIINIKIDKLKKLISDFSIVGRDLMIFLNHFIVDRNDNKICGDHFSSIYGIFCKIENSINSIKKSFSKFDLNGKYYVSNLKKDNVFSQINPCLINIERSKFILEIADGVKNKCMELKECFPLSDNGRKPTPSDYDFIYENLAEVKKQIGEELNLYNRSIIFIENKNN